MQAGLLLYNGDMWQEEDVAAGGLSMAGVCSRAQLGLERHDHELGPPGSQLVHRHCPCGWLQPPAALLSPAGRGYASLCSAISIHHCCSLSRGSVRYRSQRIASAGVLSGGWVQRLALQPPVSVLTLPR